MNRKTANTCLTDMINISIGSFKLILNEINRNKKLFNIINHYPWAVKMHFSLKACLMRRWRILDTFMVMTFAGALRQALLHVLEAELFSCALRYAMHCTLTQFNWTTHTHCTNTTIYLLPLDTMQRTSMTLCIRPM